MEKVYVRSAFGSVLAQGRAYWPLLALISQKMNARRENARVGSANEMEDDDED